MDKLILIGFGGHAKSIADCIERQGKYTVVGYTDRFQTTSQYKYLGKDTVLEEYFKKEVRYAFVGLGYLGKSDEREYIYTKLKAIGYKLPVIIDPSAIVSETAKIAEGTFVGKRVVINAEADVGKMCIINTGAIIEHESKIDDFTHISVGAVLCGQVSVGKAAFIGANATIIQNKCIPEKKIIPAGVTVR